MAMADFGDAGLRLAVRHLLNWCRQLPLTAICLCLILDIRAIGVFSLLNTPGSLACPAPPRLTCTCCSQGQNMSQTDTY